MPRVILSSKAEDDLSEIWAHIAAENEPAAERVITQIQNKAALLAEQPEAGSARPDLGPGLRSFPAGSYLLVYRPSENGIHVARVIHSARDVAAIIDE